MINQPKTKEEAIEILYNKWGGNPKGTAYDENKCAYEVWGDFALSYQCSRKPGHGPDNLYCKQHAKIVNANG